ncbi:hypothetical protein KC19_9G064300 [Ceratodon purpureus]|uniref:AP2/ERF domain-containing protein n=1 Tax=Ceratodon purpureus TaxID=3225 RepID=A0A8T0GST6_CERPU|nr:hypothetical protein KC19_9G064300 [Ceratodon purpureus]
MFMDLSWLKGLAPRRTIRKFSQDWFDPMDWGSTLDNLQERERQRERENREREREERERRERERVVREREIAELKLGAELPNGVAKLELPFRLQVLDILTLQTFDVDWEVHDNNLQNVSSLSVGDNEQFFQVFNDHLSIATARRWDNKVVSKLYKLIKKAVKKAAKNRKLREALGEALAKVMSKSGTTVNINEQLQYLESLLALFPKSVCSELEQVFGAMLVSALVLLYCVSQYLMGYADRGRSKTYSSGSLDFRDIYVSIVLFQGAYVWIKFRQAARFGCNLKRKSCETPDVAVRDDEPGVKGVYRRPGTKKYEPRLKPPREKLDSGPVILNHLSLGQYDTSGEAEIVYQVAAFYYGKGEARVALEDGSFFSIPPMSEEAKCLTGMDKARWVTCKAKEIFKILKMGKLRPLNLLRTAETGARSGPDGSDAGSDPSQSAIGDISPLPALRKSAVENSESALIASVELALAQGGSGSEQIADCVPDGSMNYEPTPAVEHISGVNCSREQYIVMGRENDTALESDDHGETLGLGSELPALSDYKDMIMFQDSTNVSSPQQIRNLGLHRQTGVDYDRTDSQSAEGSSICEPVVALEHFSGEQCDALESDDQAQIYELTEGMLQGFEVQKSAKLDSLQRCDNLGAVQENIVTNRGSTDIIIFKERDPGPVFGQVSRPEDSAIIKDLQRQLREANLKILVLEQENQHCKVALQQVGNISQAAMTSHGRKDVSPIGTVCVCKSLAVCNKCCRRDS